MSCFSIKYPECTSNWLEHVKLQFSPVRTLNKDHEAPKSQIAIGPKLSCLKVKLVKNVCWVWYYASHH